MSSAGSFRPEDLGHGDQVAGGLPILLVEDNPGDVELVREALAAHEVKADIFVAADGAVAMVLIERIDTNELPCPELIVLDINLPKHNGFEVLKRIRQSAKCKKTPVVIFSSSGDPKDREKAANLGADLFLKKPLDLNDFVATGKQFKALLPPKAG